MGVWVRAYNGWLQRPQQSALREALQVVASVHDDERHSWRGLGLAALPPTRVERTAWAVLPHRAPSVRTFRHVGAGISAPRTRSRRGLVSSSSQSGQICTDAICELIHHRQRQALAAKRCCALAYMRGAFHGDGRAENIGYRGSIAPGCAAHQRSADDQCRRVDLHLLLGAVGRHRASL